MEHGPQTLDEAMAAINRWPLWMWRNMEFQALVEWLRDFNEGLDPAHRVGIYGIDVYDHEASMADVVGWISSIDTDLGDQAERLYSCMTRHPAIGDYIQMVARTGDDCSEDNEEVLELVRSLQDHPDASEWGFFKAEHGAKVAINAELHYRANLQQGPQSWNYRASHFYLTAERLLDYYGENSRGIIWAHNTHIGDASATDMGQVGMHNIGQLSREALGNENTFAIGFGTYTGEVLAGREWEGAMRSMNTPEAREDSWEHLLMETGHEKLYLYFGDDELSSALQQRYPHRAIGVTYNPANETNNYVPTVLPDRYDAFIFIHTTTTLDPLD
jgi:erythromycin esterase